MTKFCTSVDIYDVIAHATFCDDRLRGLGVARGQISRFPIDLRRRPYNTLALPCECVIQANIFHCQLFRSKMYAGPVFMFDVKGYRRQKLKVYNYV